MTASADFLMQIVHAELASTGVLQACAMAQLYGGAARIIHAGALGRLQAELAGILPQVQAIAAACRTRARVISRGSLAQLALAWMVTGKYQDAVPPYRQAKR